MDEPTAETERDEELARLKAVAHGGETLMDREPGGDSQTGSKADYVGLKTGEVPVPQPEKTETENDQDLLQSHGIEIGGPIKVSLDTTSIVLNDRYDIHPSSPPAQSDSPSAHAFEAESLASEGVDVFALVCIPDLAVRIDVIKNLVGNTIPSCLDLMDYGVAYWPPLERKTFILIFERPLGGRVSDVLNNEKSDYNKIDYIKSCLDAMIIGLDELHSRDIYHRAIRHDNLFFRDDQRQDVVLGEFVSSPPGFDQPIAYETIERSMADDGGRGIGRAEEDMYACGVALAIMTQKSAQTPSSKEHLIIAKITDSSYQTLVGNDLITGTLLDVIRGLLNDDPSHRWGMEELESWSEGRRVPPSQPPRPTKARKPLQFDGIDHIYLRTLAYAAAEKPGVALKLIKDGTIPQWLRQELKDEDLASIIEDLTLQAETNPERPETDHVLIAQTLICLDPRRQFDSKACHSCRRLLAQR